MNTRNIDNAKYTSIKPVRGGKPLFVNMADDSAIETLRSQYDNRDLLISTCYYTAPDASAPRIEPLRFHIASRDLEEVRISTLEVCFYINERFYVPLDCQEITLIAGADIADNSNATGSSKIASTNITGAATAAEMIIIAPPVTFDGRSTLLAVLNYYLARRMIKDGIQNINVDVYEQNFIPLVNSIRFGRCVIPLTTKELLYLDVGGISELTKQPRPEDSLVVPRFVPEAAELFAKTCAEFEKEQRQQDKLRKLILQKGWQIPPCIRRLSWADLSEDRTLEACRLISGTYSFLGSHEDEIWYHILRLARRNSIQSVRGHQKLRAIITFALENPMLPECVHPLVRQFCPAGGCYIAELLEECRQPGLFEGLSGECTQPENR